MAEKNYNFDDLFHPRVEMGAENQKNLQEYNPAADKGNAGVYRSVVRFVTWWQDPAHSIIEKWVCWLVDPISTRGRYVDCPSSVGKPSPLQDMFFKLRKSDSVQEQKKAEIFSRRHSFAAIVQVLRDDQNKDAVGKLLVWKFGKKVWDKIDAEKKPLVGEPHEPFDLIDGKAFEITVTKVSGYNNYDQSKFLDKKIPLLMPDANGKLSSINARTPRETVFNFLKENSPDLNKYTFKEWDSETHEYVNSIILAVTGKTPSATVADIRNSNAGAKGATVGNPKPTPKNGITVEDLNLDDLNEGSSDIPDLDLPDLNTNNDIGISGDLDDAFANL